ncbi:MAG: glycosyltransferase family 2 protein [Nitrososphaerota archaeon]|nr:glycosyltransferase family 2 protein [Nitrososphaerota archaeon]MDG6926911.1 glycosyltransferase family 2 protein [Nitrososphaerota archaeon]MDG6929971.1 glycosyltransferase family 2 protein [Nitrososphaerota archaeon]MDG6931922.1 glycosyltransferase family 2 protein [Nitrososphaerota archaeon]MDG6943875.1 glycosyltransferase family 2 protein [Nitrososphaerota archaeon]
MDPELVSVIIPVYRESRTVLASLAMLTNDDHPQIEIIIVVDEPSQGFLKELDNFRTVKVVLNNERKGKVSALNQAVQSSSGSYLLFADSDVLLPSNIVYNSIIEIGNYDILDYSKVGITASRISRLTSIDYLQANMISEVFSKISQKTFAIDGAAFMIKRSALKRLGGFRPMVSEDFDLATRSHKMGLKYKMSVKLKVSVGQPDNFNEWFIQRIRWAYGLGEWIKQNLRYLFRMIVYSPIIAISAVLIMLPTITMGIMLYAISSKIVSSYFITYIYYTIPSSSVPIREYILTAYYAEAGKALMASFFAFILLIPLYYYLAARYGEKFSPATFAIYYFIYQPILLMVFLIGISLSFINIKPDFDWVT